MAPAICRNGRAILGARVYEKQRRTILSSGMMTVRGRVQREGEVVHLVLHRQIDLPAELASLGEREESFAVTYARGDQAKAVGGPDPRDGLAQKARDIFIPILILAQLS